MISRLKVGRAMLAIVVAIAAGILAVAMPTPEASAAELSGVVDPGSIKITNASGSTEFQGWEEARLVANWAVPAGTTARTGDTFSLQLDPNGGPTLASNLDFVLNVTDDPSTNVANCKAVAATGKVTCTFADYVETHPQGLSGSLFIGMYQSDTSEGQHQLTVTADGKAVPVTYTVIPGRPFEGMGFAKSGTLQKDGTVEWWINIAAGKTGLDKDYLGVTVTDRLAQGELVSVALYDATKTGGEWPIFSEAPATSYKVTKTSNSFDMTADLKQGHFYSIKVISTVPPGGTEVTNQATIKFDFKEVPVSAKVIVQTGGGSGSGTPSATLPSSATPTPRVPSTTLSAPVPAPSAPESSGGLAKTGF